jgi:hypothetical protein
MADDIAALIDHLGLEKPDVVGYSLGGGVALSLRSSIRRSSASWSLRRQTSGGTPFRRRCSPSKPR